MLLESLKIRVNNFKNKKQYFYSEIFQNKNILKRGINITKYLYNSIFYFIINFIYHIISYLKLFLHFIERYTIRYVYKVFVWFLTHLVTYYYFIYLFIRIQINKFSISIRKKAENIDKKRQKIKKLFFFKVVLKLCIISYLPTILLIWSLIKVYDYFFPIINKLEKELYEAKELVHFFLKKNETKKGKYFYWYEYLMDLDNRFVAIYWQHPFRSTLGFIFIFFIVSINFILLVDLHVIGVSGLSFLLNDYSIVPYKGTTPTLESLVFKYYRIPFGIMSILLLYFTFYSYFFMIKHFFWRKFLIIIKTKYRVSYYFYRRIKVNYRKELKRLGFFDKIIEMQSKIKYIPPYLNYPPEDNYIHEYDYNLLDKITKYRNDPNYRSLFLNFFLIEQNRFERKIEDFIEAQLLELKETLINVNIIIELKFKRKKRALKDKYIFLADLDKLEKEIDILGLKRDDERKSIALEMKDKFFFAILKKFNNQIFDQIENKIIPKEIDENIDEYNIIVTEIKMEFRKEIEEKINNYLRSRIPNEMFIISTNIEVDLYEYKNESLENIINKKVVFFENIIFDKEFYEKLKKKLKNENEKTFLIQ